MATVNGLHVEDTVSVVRAEIMEIYRVYNPPKLSEVPVRRSAPKLVAILS